MHPRCLRRDSLVFGEDVSILIASGGDREYAVSRGGVPFHLVHVNVNVEDSLWGGFDLDVPQFGKRRAGVSVGG